MSSVALYFRYVGVSVRGQLQYRASLVMFLLGKRSGRKKSAIVEIRRV